MNLHALAKVSHIDNILTHHLAQEIRTVFMLSVQAYIILDSTHFRPMLDCIVAFEACELSMEWMIQIDDSITWGYLISLNFVTNNPNQ